MNKKIWDTILTQWDTVEELAVSKKISLENREIYPVNKISVLFQKSGKIANLNIIPLAWIINEKEENNPEKKDHDLETDYYMVLFDTDNLNLVEDIIKEFKSFYNHSDHK
ncbi:MAG: hypothetical protein CVV28_09015 [Methanobacteriales archaeon HGW-Methanobacteriales-1]|jgi:hypothetical protein|nr:MAG: hypothetical protein CVV28_09015 [Methanobacteriales archaeon HGW-Methanobacteriales-1]